MKCIRTKQIHDYNSNIIYTQYKQHKASTKNTHTHKGVFKGVVQGVQTPPPPENFRFFFEK